MHKILFLHPDPKLTGIYRRFLSNYFSVDSAHDGLDGLRLIKQHKPSLIISDYSLPLITGRTLLRFVRSHPELYATPFIFLTNYNPTADGLSLGATDWLVQAKSNPSLLLEKCLNQLKIKTNV
jgi:CheY-like chemotaxis protein